MKQAVKKQYVLRYFKDFKGMPHYFEKRVPIGPLMTTDPAKAARFDSIEEAQRANVYPLAPMDVEEAP